MKSGEEHDRRARNTTTQELRDRAGGFESGFATRHRGLNSNTQKALGGERGHACTHARKRTHTCSLGKGTVVPETNRREVSQYL